MTITARTLVTQALRTLEILAEDSEPTAGQGADALALLNEIIDAWLADDAFCAVLERNTYTLTAGEVTRTIGPTGNLVDDVPVEITAAAVIGVSGTDEYPVDIIDAGEYERIPDKATTASWPYKLRYEPTSPNGTLKFYPVPSTACTLVLYSLAPFASNALVLATSLDLRAGYARALRLTLAENLSPYFGVPMPPTLPYEAAQARAVVQRKNHRPRRVDTAVAGIPGSHGGHWDYMTGRYR